MGEQASRKAWVKDVFRQNPELHIYRKFKKALEAGEMSLLGKCLSLDLKGVNWIPKTHIKKLGMVPYTSDPAPGRGTWGPLGILATSLTQSASPRFCKRPCL